ncbi:MAG: multicopper oxidase domain-containing protein [Methanobacteriota archaeon]
MLDDMDKFHIQSLDPGNQNAPQTSDPFAYEEFARRQAQDAANNNPFLVRGAQTTGATKTRDWYPVTYPAYAPFYNTFIANGAAFPYGEPIRIAEGEAVRVRLVNAGFTVFSMHVHGHSMLLTHKDGYPLASPVRGDTFGIVPGERLDLLLEGTNPGIWMFHDHSGFTTQNEGIDPGGMMTEIVYPGFEERSMLVGGLHAASGFRRPAAGAGDVRLATPTVLADADGAAVGVPFGKTPVQNYLHAPVRDSITR